MNIEVNTDAKTNAVQGSQNSRFASESHSESEREAGGVRGDSGDLSVRTSRAISPERDIERLLISHGGIISRLIEEEEERIAYNQECIEWYEREKKKSQKKLEELRRLSKDFNE